MLCSEDLVARERTRADRAVDLFAIQMSLFKPWQLRGEGPSRFTLTWPHKYGGSHVVAVTLSPGAGGPPAAARCELATLPAPGAGAPDNGMHRGALHAFGEAWLRRVAVGGPRGAAAALEAVSSARGVPAAIRAAGRAFARADEVLAELGSLAARRYEVTPLDGATGTLEVRFSSRAHRRLKLRLALPAAYPEAPLEVTGVEWGAAVRMNARARPGAWVGRGLGRGGAGRGGA